MRRAVLSACNLGTRHLQLGVAAQVEGLCCHSVKQQHQHQQRQQQHKEQEHQALQNQTQQPVVQQYDAAAFRDRTWDASCSSHEPQQASVFQHQHPQQAWQQRYLAPLQSSPQLMQHLQQPQHLFSQQQQQQFRPGLPHWTLWRCYSARPQVNPTMPPDLANLISEAATIKPERPPAPPVEPRPLTFDSRRSGVIAIKAGMMQDWDEYGARVPLTVLWVDECMVS